LISQIIFFYVPYKKESHTGLKWQWEKFLIKALMPVSNRLKCPGKSSFVVFCTFVMLILSWLVRMRCSS